MSVCGRMVYRVRPQGRASVPSARDSQRPWADDPRAVHGTWDYKWPADSTIRVAFLGLSTREQSRYFDPHPDSHWVRETMSAREIKLRVEEVARRWVEGTNLRFEFNHHDDYPAASESVGCGTRGRPGDYHVLVSLAPLPFTDTNHVTHGSTSDDQSIHFPSAELGRFACRAAYGHATVFLGKREGYTREYAQQNQGILEHEEYFRSREFRHWVCHEFGHVVGLAHIHQDPRIPGNVFREESEVIQEIKRESRRVVTPEFVQRGILERWPCLLSADHTEVKYSDWWDHLPQAASPQAYLRHFQSSVMTHSIIGRLVRGAASSGQTLHLPDTPLEPDQQLVRRMYPPRDHQERTAQGTPKHPARRGEVLGHLDARTEL